MAQANYAGIPNDALIENGPYSTNMGIPLGLRHTDGKRSFRWGHVAESVYNTGVCVVKRLSGDAGKFITTSAYHRSCAYDNGYGGANALGSIDIYLYSAVFLSNKKYEDGDMMIVSSTGRGHSYPIDSYEIGAAGKRTHLKIKRGLGAAIGTGTQAIFLENSWYGLQKPLQNLGDYTALADGKAIGATTASDGSISNTSGYQWLQTGGPGPGYKSSTVWAAAGDPLGVANSGHLSNPYIVTTCGGVTLSGMGKVAIALHPAAATDFHGFVDWLIETPL